MPSLTKTDGSRLATPYRKARLGTELGTQTEWEANSLNHQEKKVGVVPSFDAAA